MQEIGIESSVLKNIRLGRKTIEGRLSKGKFLRLKVGDVVSLREDIWNNGNIIESVQSDVKIRITKILHFKSFKEMLESVDYQTVIPDATSPSEAAAVYRKYYTAEDEREFGVLAIMFVAE